MASILRLALALLLTFTSLIKAQDTVIPLVCHQGVQIIGVVGTGVANGSQSYGLTVTFVQGVMAQIPDSANISMNYNRFPPNGTETPAVFIPEVNEGVGALYGLLQNYTAACPNTPIVLHGYSQGAVVVLNLLCGASSGSFPVTSPLDSSYASQIIGVILYGDESRTANQSYNLGGCTASSAHLGRRTPQGCSAFAPSMKSYCYPNDVDCCATANASVPYPYGINWHYLYPAQFDNEAISFVVSRYNSYKNATNSTSSISSSSSMISSTAPYSNTTTPVTSSTLSSSTSISSTSISTTSVSTTSTSLTSTSPTSTSPASTSPTSTSPTSTSPTSTSPTSTSPTSTSTTSTSTTSTSTTSTSTTSTSTTSTSTSSSSTSTSFTTSTKPTTTTTKTTSTKSTSTKTTITTAKTTSTKSTTTTSTTSTSLSIASTCTSDKCIASLTSHPKTASSVCSALASGTISTVFPSVCSGNYASRASSACACMGFATSTATTTAA